MTSSNAQFVISHDGNIESADLHFLGSHWNFYVLKDGRAFWVHDRGEIIPSSRLLKGKTT